MKVPEVAALQSFAALPVVICGLAVRKTGKPPNAAFATRILSALTVQVAESLLMQMIWLKPSPGTGLPIRVAHDTLC